MESELTARFIEKLWHVVLPFTLLFVVAGLALTVLVKTIEKRLIKFIRERRGIQTSGKIAAHKIPEHAGVIEAPACPQCGSKMVLREARRGAHAGQSFWGLQPISGLPRYSSLLIFASLVRASGSNTSRAVSYVILFYCNIALRHGLRTGMKEEG